MAALAAQEPGPSHQQAEEEECHEVRPSVDGWLNLVGQHSIIDFDR